MRLVYLFIFVLLTHSLLSSGQTKYLSNPSFDGYIGQGYAPNDWYACNDLSTLDTRPYSWFDDPEPTDGNTYLGLVMRGPNDTIPKNEDAITKLLSPLHRDTTYYLSIDLALLPTEFDVFPDYNLYYSNPAKIRISGGVDSCADDEVLAISDLISNAEWERFNIEFTPTLNSYTYLKIEIYLEEMKASYIVLDNLSLSALEILGPAIVCQGEENVRFYTPHIECATDYVWSYSGTGADITSYGDSVSVDFSNTATSGILSLKLTNCDKGRKSVHYPVNIELLSENNAGTIVGDSEICINGGRYSYSTIGGTANEYTWSYSTPGASIYEFGDSASIYFNYYAEDGILSVQGDGACRSTFPILTKNRPSGSGEIIGEAEVCLNEKQVVYRAAELLDASEYIWTFSGTGTNINSNSDSVLLDFSQTATSGYLQVRGVNECGEGGYATNFIDVLSANVGVAEIYGQNQICLSDGKATFSCSHLYDATDYIWSYDGEGVILDADSKRLNIEFTDGATNGNLTVAGSNKCGTGSRSLNFPITLLPLPSGGEIIGESEVCLNQNNVSYELKGVDNASSFTWAFGGKDFEYSSFSDRVVFDFGPNATGGVLRMTANNICGKALDSPLLSITVNKKPSIPEIIGSDDACVNNTSVFTVKSTEDVTDFTWTYSGKDSVLDSNFDEISLSFNSIGNSGTLGVVAQNECGVSEPSMPLSINVELCELHIPNTFSPNGDGVNDFYVIRGVPTGSRLSVLDRMGSKVYESKNYQNDWDGSDISGELLRTDTYWYVLTIPGVQSEYKGYIYLKR